MVKGTVRAKHKGVMRLPHNKDPLAEGVVGCHGNRMTPTGFKDEKIEELKSSSSPSSSSSSAMTSLRELEQAASGRTNNSKLDDVKARLAKPTDLFAFTDLLPSLTKALYVKSNAGVHWS